MLGIGRIKTIHFLRQYFVCDCEKKRKRECQCDWCAWLWYVRLCRVAVTVSTHCSSHNCRTQLPPPLLPLCCLMPLLVQTWGLSRTACRLFTATPKPPSSNPTPPLINSVGTPWDPHQTPSAEGGFKRPKLTACPVISYFKDSFQ